MRLESGVYWHQIEGVKVERYLDERATFSQFGRLISGGVAISDANELLIQHFDVSSLDLQSLIRSEHSDLSNAECPRSFSTS